MTSKLDFLMQSKWDNVLVRNNQKELTKQALACLGDFQADYTERLLLNLYDLLFFQSYKKLFWAMSSGLYNSSYCEPIDRTIILLLEFFL